MTVNVYRAQCATKAGRALMARRLIELAAECGAAVIEHLDPAPLHPRGIWITLGIGPYRVNIALDGDSHVGAFLGHWHTDLDSDAKYPPGFPSESVNRYHYAKATTCRDSFLQLCDSLRKCFAFLSEQTASAKAA